MNVDTEFLLLVSMILDCSLSVSDIVQPKKASNDNLQGPDRTARGKIIGKASIGALGENSACK